MLGFLSEYEVFYDVLGFANFSLNEFATQAGPINKNCKSSKNDGFLPSILWPTNCPIHATTNTPN